MQLPGRDYGDLRRAYQRSDHREVLAIGERIVAALDADPRRHPYLPAAMVMIGASLAQVEHYTEAVAWLEQGLARAVDQPVASDLRPNPHWFHELLCDLYLLLGRWDRAEPYLDWLALPNQHLYSRLSATRGEAQLAAVRGNFDAAHYLVNAAADLARRARSSLLAAMVEGDRVLVLAAQGRLREAVAYTDRIAPDLLAPSASPPQAMANLQGTTMLTTLARLLADAGDSMTAERYLLEVAPAVQQLHRSYAVGLFDLARGAVRRAEGDLSQAEEPLTAAVQRFEALGTLPALVLANVERGRLAEARGHLVSARSSYEHAAGTATALGMAREARWLRERLFVLPTA